VGVEGFPLSGESLRERTEKRRNGNEEQNEEERNGQTEYFYQRKEGKGKKGQRERGNSRRNETEDFLLDQLETG